jgi:peptidoglycan pentaglycine glycine transferase (the first glycine)
MNSPLTAALPPALPSVQPLTGILAPPPPQVDRWTEWDAFVERTPESGFMQTSWWADFRNTCGFENFGVTLKDAGNIVGGAVVLKFFPTDDTCFYYIPHGPVLPTDPDLAEAVFQSTLDAIDDHRQAESCLVTHLRIEPRWLQVPAFVTGFRAVAPFADPYLEPRDTRVIDLRPSEDAILAQMKPKGRYNIRLAQRHGVSIIEDISEQGLADFISLHEETAERQGMEAKPADYFQALVSLLLPNRRVSIFFAEYRGIRLATALVIYFGRTATYFFGGSRDLHREVMAPYLLHFEIMRKAKSLGHESYDLWGIAPPNQPDHPWTNITNFKAKFGGSELYFVPTLDLIYDPDAYAAYTASHRDA